MTQFTDAGMRHHVLYSRQHSNSLITVTSHDHHGVPDHRPFECLLNSFPGWYQSKFRVTGPLWGESTSDRWIPLHIGRVRQKMFPCHDVIIWSGTIHYQISNKHILPSVHHVPSALRNSSSCNRQSCRRKPSFGKIGLAFATRVTASVNGIVRWIIKYARTRDADRLVPRTQWTNTRPKMKKNALKCWQTTLYESLIETVFEIWFIWERFVDTMCLCFGKRCLHVQNPRQK